MAGKGEGKQANVLSALERIHMSIGANLDLEEISRMLIEELCAATDCSGCAILLIEREDFRILAEKSALELFEGGDYSVAMPGIKEIVESKESFVTGDLMGSPAKSWLPSGCEMNSLIRVPILFNGGVKGIVHLDAPGRDAFDEGDVRFVELMAQEISIVIKESALKGRVKALSTKDDLTGCLNRKKLEEDLQAEIARAKRYERELSLLLLEVNWLKEKDGSAENAVDDEILKRIIDSFKQTARIVDAFYRYGGRVIAIVLPETGKDRALFVARRFQKIIVQEGLGKAKGGRLKGDRSKNHVSLNIGIASYPWDGDNRDQILRFADAALYRAKSAGPNKVYVFERISARTWTN